MRIARMTVAAAATAALLGGAGAGVAAAAPDHAAATASSECQPGTLKATTNDGLDSHQHGMNHVGTYLQVKNTGDSTCTLKGYPGLALEKSGHKSAKTDVRHGDTYFAQDPGSHGVKLKPGASAYADLEWTHTGAHAVHAKHLQISPTGSNAHSVVSFDQVVDQGQLNVTAWSAKAPK